MPGFQFQAALGPEPILQDKHVVPLFVNPNITFSAVHKKRAWHYISLRLRRHKLFKSLDALLSVCNEQHLTLYQNAEVTQQEPLIIRYGPPLMPQYDLYREAIRTKRISGPQVIRNRNRIRYNKKCKDLLHGSTLYSKLICFLRSVKPPTYIKGVCDSALWDRDRQRCTQKHVYNKDALAKISMTIRGKFVVKRQYKQYVVELLDGKRPVLFSCAFSIELSSLKEGVGNKLDHYDYAHFYANGIEFEEYDKYSSIKPVGADDVIGYGNQTVDYAVDPTHRSQ
jgi:hypothetical protein